jgi:uncharacterized RDD family membrane protein YckC
MPPQPPPAEPARAEAPLSILSRELPMQQEEPLQPPLRASSPPSFRVARPLPDTDPYITETEAPGESDAVSAALRVVRVAPVWRRAGAWLVDATVLFAIVWGFLWMATGLVHHAPPSRQSGLDWLAETLLAYGKVWVPALGLFSLITVGYLALFTALGGQTPGKRLFRLQVVDSTGADPSIFRSAVRAVLALGSGLLVLMGFLLVIFDRRRQTLHDKLARTFVICLS